MGMIGGQVFWGQVASTLGAQVLRKIDLAHVMKKSGQSQLAEKLSRQTQLGREGSRQDSNIYRVVRAFVLMAFYIDQREERMFLAQGHVDDGMNSSLEPSQVGVFPLLRPLSGLRHCFDALEVSSNRLTPGFFVELVRKIQALASLGNENVGNLVLGAGRFEGLPRIVGGRERAVEQLDEGFQLLRSEAGHEDDFSNVPLLEEIEHVVEALKAAEVDLDANFVQVQAFIEA